MTSPAPVLREPARAPIAHWPTVSPEVHRQQEVKRNLAALILLFAAPDAKARLERLAESPTKPELAMLPEVIRGIGRAVAGLACMRHAHVNADVLKHMPAPGDKNWATFDPQAVAIVLGQLITKDDKGRKTHDCERAVLPALANAELHLHEPDCFAAHLGDLSIDALPLQGAYHEAAEPWARRPLPDSPIYLRRSRQLFWAGWSATAGSFCFGSAKRTAITAAVGAALAIGVAVPGGLIGGAAVVAVLGGLMLAGRWAILHAARNMPEAERVLVEKGQQGPLKLEDFYECFHAMAQASGITPPEQVPPAVPGFRKAGRLQKFRDFMTMVTWFAHAGATNRARAWPNIMHPAAMALMNRLEWDPHFVHLERLEEVRRAQAAREAIIFVIHHSGDLDTPAMLTVVGKFNPRIAAKKVLTWVPAHGRVATVHPNRPSRWGADASMADCLLVDRQAQRAARKKLVRESLEAFDAGQSVAIFGQGTRQRTAEPGYESASGQYKTTMMTIAEAVAAIGRPVRLVPIHLMGSSTSMSSKYSRLRRDGLGSHLPWVIAVGESVAFETLKASVAGQNDQTRSDRRLTDAFWLHAMRELIPLQRVYYKMIADLRKV